MVNMTDTSTHDEPMPTFSTDVVGGENPMQNTIVYKEKALKGGKFGEKTFEGTVHSNVVVTFYHNEGDRITSEVVDL
jgi:hypothetical protein